MFGVSMTYLYNCANCSSLLRYLSQGNPFRSILALDWSMCENVSCFPLHTSNCMVATETTGSNCHSLIIRRTNPWHNKKFTERIEETNHYTKALKTVKAADVSSFCDLPLQLCKLQLSVEIFVPGQSFPFHFGAGLEHVRARVLFPPPHVKLHGCHDDHWLQLPFTDD